jgi:hypothetical protein
MFVDRHPHPDLFRPLLRRIEAVVSRLAVIAPDDGFAIPGATVDPLGAARGIVLGSGVCAVGWTILVVMCWLLF